MDADGAAAAQAGAGRGGAGHDDGGDRARRGARRATAAAGAHGGDRGAGAAAGLGAHTGADGRGDHRRRRGDAGDVRTTENYHSGHGGTRRRGRIKEEERDGGGWERGSRRIGVATRWLSGMDGAYTTAGRLAAGCAGRYNGAVMPAGRASLGRRRAGRWTDHGRERPRAGRIPRRGRELENAWS